MAAKRIETAEAKALRGRRQRFAAPGGSHDRLVRLLAVILPMGIGIVAALIIVVPLGPRGEVSFLLDRNEVETVNNRVAVQSALYRGQDVDGKPFSLTAGRAVQRSAAEGLVYLNNLSAQILLTDGPARLTAQGGIYDPARQQVQATSPVLFTAADGYRMLVRGVGVDLRQKELTGAGGVSAVVPAGTFRADRLEASLSTRTITLEGNARGRLVPGELRMP